VNKSPRGEYFTIAVWEKNAPGNFLGGRFFHATPELFLRHRCREAAPAWPVAEGTPPCGDRGKKHFDEYFPTESGP